MCSAYYQAYYIPHVIYSKCLFGFHAHSSLFEIPNFHLTKKEGFLQALFISRSWSKNRKDMNVMKILVILPCVMLGAYAGKISYRISCSFVSLDRGTDLSCCLNEQLF